jgi:hypothetical protein
LLLRPSSPQFSDGVCSKRPSLSFFQFDAFSSMPVLARIGLMPGA